MSDRTARKNWFIFKFILVGIWLALLCGLLMRDAFITSVSIQERNIRREADREEYQGIYFNNAKIGYMVNRYETGDSGTLHIDQLAEIHINVAEMVHRVILRLQADLLEDNSLHAFDISLESPFQTMHAKGEVAGNVIDINLQTGNESLHKQVPVDSSPVIPSARRSYLLKKGIQPGDKMKLPFFDPMSLATRNTVVEYKGLDDVFVNGRVLPLHKFMQTISGVRLNFWLDDAGDVVKEESPAGFVFLKEPKYRAMAEETIEPISADFLNELIRP
ncbi:hypothetical protein [Desulfogranum japonicum]|uniref:hypothetical protein n=1 Tax=Desulfogranum japonicum TaxID=231447 RepID=UPI0004270072|nr:hypothetical protein [Desulfogranum japonicum]